MKTRSLLLGSAAIAGLAPMACALATDYGVSGDFYINYDNGYDQFLLGGGSVSFSAIAVDNALNKYGADGVVLHGAADLGGGGSVQPVLMAASDENNALIKNAADDGPASANADVNAANPVDLLAAAPAAGTVDG